MSQLVTLTKSSAEFRSYLDGSFSDTLIAIPLSTLNVQTESETVTFNVIEKTSVEVPNRVLFLLKLLKLRSFIWLMFPMLIVLWRASIEQLLRDSFAATSASLGLIFLFAGFNLRNDYLDHMRGFDRLVPTAGSQAIQKAWIRAIEVNEIAKKCILAAALFAIPSLVAFPATIVYIFVAIIVSVAGHIDEKKAQRFWMSEEISFFLLIGPLLCSGYEYSMSGVFRKDTLIFGMLWGWAALFAQHLKNFENILVHSQAGWKNLVSVVGFDRAVKVIRWWWISLISFFFLYQLRYGGYFWSWYLTLGIAFFSLPFFIRLSEVTSPLGSSLRKIRLRGQFLITLVMCAFLLEHLWYTIQDLQN